MTEKQEAKFQLGDLTVQVAPKGWSHEMTEVDRVEKSHVVYTTIYKRDGADQFLKFEWRRSHLDPDRCTGEGLDGLPVTQVDSHVKGVPVKKETAHQVQVTWV